jgi:hypothetical protein
MWPASGASLYIYEPRSQNFLSLGVKWNDAVRLPKFPTKRAAVLPDCRRPSNHPALLQECPADLHERPAPSPRGPSPASARAPPLLPWTAAAPSSVGTPQTADLLPERHCPSSLPGWRLPPRGPLPQPPARIHRWQIRRRRQRRRRLRRQLRCPYSLPTPHLLPAHHAWRPRMGPAAQRRPPRLGWFFSKCNYICIFFNMDYGLWINRFKNVKVDYALCIHRFIISMDLNRFII